MNRGEFLVVSVITLIVVVIWVTSELIHSRNAAIPNPDAAQYLEPVEPNFNQTTLDRIGGLATPAPTALIVTSPPPTPTPARTATPSATVRPSGSPTATPRVSPTPAASSLFP